jgi:SAM-dependent methyltransferase
VTKVDSAAFTAFEAAGWEQSAEAYDRFFEPITSRVIGDLLDAAEVGTGTRVLDVATGPGYVAAAAAERGAAPVGVDGAGAMVELASGRHPELTFVRAPAEELPFDDGEFDAAVANFLLLHVAEPERVTAELVRVLAPGGSAAFTVWDVRETCRLFGVVLDAVEAAGVTRPADLPQGPDFFRFSDDHEFRTLLAGAGLAGVEVRTLSFSHRVASADDIWDGFARGTVRTRGLIDRQSADVRARIRERLDEALEPYCADGGFDLAVAVKLASGRKP